MHGRPPHLPGSIVMRSRREGFTVALYRRIERRLRARGRRCDRCLSPCAHLGAEVDLEARGVHGRLFGQEVEFARHARPKASHVARDLQPGVREFERPPTVAAAGVLGADQLLEHIEVRALEPRSEAVADIPRKLADLRDDPAQDVTGEPNSKASGRSRERSNYGAPAGKDTMCCERLGTFGAVMGAQKGKGKRKEGEGNY